MLTFEFLIPDQFDFIDVMTSQAFSSWPFLASTCDCLSCTTLPLPSIASGKAEGNCERYGHLVPALQPYSS